MISQNIIFKNFKLINKNHKLKQKLILILLEENEVINSLKKSYKNSYTKKLIKKFKNSKNFRLIGMGGSILGSEAIYNFLRNNKKFYFINNLRTLRKDFFSKSSTNIIISKSGNTLETIVNINLFSHKTLYSNNDFYETFQKFKQ